MQVMISINPPYTDMIFSGYKPYEFRKRVLKGMDEWYPPEEIIAYIYETKNKGGAGAVIGEVKIAGSYTPNYGKDSETDTFVVERNECIKSLYLRWCESKHIKPNMKEGWFKSKRFLHYLEEIGFGPKLDFNYALILDNPRKYEVSLPLNNFRNTKGETLARPPQNMFRVARKNTNQIEGADQ